MHRVACIYMEEAFNRYTLWFVKLNPTTIPIIASIINLIRPRLLFSREYLE